MRNFPKPLSQLGKRGGANVNVIYPGATETLGLFGTAVAVAAALALTM